MSVKVVIDAIKDINDIMGKDINLGWYCNDINLQIECVHKLKISNNYQYTLYNPENKNKFQIYNISKIEDDITKKLNVVFNYKYIYLTEEFKLTKIKYDMLTKKIYFDFTHIITNSNIKDIDINVIINSIKNIPKELIREIKSKINILEKNDNYIHEDVINSLINMMVKDKNYDLNTTIIINSKLLSSEKRKLIRQTTRYSTTTEVEDNINYQRRYYLKNKEELKIKRKEYYAMNKEKIAAKRKEYYDKLKNS